MTAASAPFPSQRMGFVGSPSGVALIPERDTFIRPSYQPHQNPEGTIVKQNGVIVGQGFTVAEMLPERRWAVKEDGELLGQLEFREAYIQYLREWFLYASPEAKQGNGFVPKDFVPEREPIPSVSNYVSWQIDPAQPGDPRVLRSGRIREMGYDPDATKGATSKRLWDSENERFLEGADRMAALTAQYRLEANGGNKVLRPKEIEEVQAYLAGNPLPTEANATQARLAVLTELKSKGVLTKEQYADQVAEIFIGKPVERKVAAKGHTLMPCGEEVPNLHKAKHTELCAYCSEMGK